jgi:hypothetical protein
MSATATLFKTQGKTAIPGCSGSSSMFQVLDGKDMKLWER